MISWKMVISHHTYPIIIYIYAYFRGEACKCIAFIPKDQEPKQFPLYLLDVVVAVLFKFNVRVQGGNIFDVWYQY